MPTRRRRGTNAQRRISCMYYYSVRRIVRLTNICNHRIHLIPSWSQKQNTIMIQPPSAFEYSIVRPNPRRFIEAASGRIDQVLTVPGLAENKASGEIRGSGALKSDCIRLTRSRTPLFAKFTSRTIIREISNARLKRKGYVARRYPSFQPSLPLITP
jgi:hypothetical protein